MDGAGASLRGLGALSFVLATPTPSSRPTYALAVCAHLGDRTARTAARTARGHQAPPLASVAGAVIEDPPAVRARPQTRPRSIGDGGQDDRHESAPGAIPAEPNDAAGSARCDVETPYPGIEDVVSGRHTLDDAAQVVTKLTHDGTAAKPVDRLAGVIGDEPRVQQCPDAFQIARRSLVVDVNHCLSLPVAARAPSWLPVKEIAG